MRSFDDWFDEITSSVGAKGAPEVENPCEKCGVEMKETGHSPPHGRQCETITFYECEDCGHSMSFP